MATLKKRLRSPGLWVMAVLVAVIVCEVWFSARTAVGQYGVANCKCVNCAVDLCCGSRVAGEYCMQGVTARPQCSYPAPYDCNRQSDNCARLLISMMGYPCWYPAGGCAGIWGIYTT